MYHAAPGSRVRKKKKCGLTNATLMRANATMLSSLTSLSLRVWSCCQEAESGVEGATCKKGAKQGWEGCVEVRFAFDLDKDRTRTELGAVPYLMKLRITASGCVAG